MRTYEYRSDSGGGPVVPSAPHRLRTGRCLPHPLGRPLDRGAPRFYLLDVTSVLLGRAAGFALGLDLLLDLLELLVGLVFQIDEDLLTRAFDGSDQLVELQVERLGVP